MNMDMDQYAWMKMDLDQYACVDISYYTEREDTEREERGVGGWRSPVASDVTRCMNLVT